MPRILCRYDVCVFNKDSQCTAKEMEYDPDQGCLTARDRDEFDGLLEDEEWDEDDDELESDDEIDDELDDDEDDEEDELFGDGDLEEELDDDL